MEWVTTSTILDGLRDYANRPAWERFVGRFREPLVRFALGIGLSQADAEDVAQETLLAFAQSYREGQYDPQKGRLGGLFGIAYRQILRERQGRARREAKVIVPAWGTSAWGELPDERTASTCWEQEWERAVWAECIRRARDEFEPETFRAFEVSVRDDRPAVEAASEWGVPVKVIYNAKHRVLKRMRELRAQVEEGV